MSDPTYWTIGRCNRLAVSVTAMVLAAWDAYRGKWILAVLMLVLAKAITEWERSVQKREGWR